ncbi:MAG: FAD-dependent oxidoreductase, partial [Clostridiales bacterium]|nr:FAD-dependent oxidoreductase [Clostridiales bacterium]
NVTAVIGGGLVGCETALHLARNGKKVTIVESLDKLLSVNGPLCHANREMLEKLIPFNNIDVICGAKAKNFKDGKLMLQTADGEKEIAVESVNLSVGYKEENSLYAQLEFDIPEIYLLGDARRVSNIMYAVWDAFEVANHI